MRIAARILNSTSLLLTACAMGLSANAQYVGQGEVEIRTRVSDVVMKPQIGQLVVIEGRLTRRLDTGVFMFTDDTAEIRIRFDPQTLVDKPVTETSMVEIRGRIAEDFRSTPEIDVLDFKILSY